MKDKYITIDEWESLEKKRRWLKKFRWSPKRNKKRLVLGIFLLGLAIAPIGTSWLFPISIALMGTSPIHTDFYFQKIRRLKWHIAQLVR